MASAPRQLLLYRFDGGAAFEGQMLGALERLESGGALRVLETLFVGRDAASGELAAFELRQAGAGGIVAPMVSFRFDPRERSRATQRALDGDAAELVRELAETLEPGEAVAAVLVAHLWAATLDDAVGRMGGAPQANAFVEAATLGELAPQLVSSARSP
ncbi:MAG TPA: hypothetical protein VFZ00_15210 [Solirubrobacter sp.]|jgi:hypothetical protein|nr:hypothetical protein [Solirubrobacter sp.]